MRDLFQITDKLLKALKPLEFSRPVTHVYNPLKYARSAYDEYLKAYGGARKKSFCWG